MLERYGHGGDLLTASEAFGHPADKFLDFSSNMNPLGPPSAVEQIMLTHWRDIVKYPDPDVRELRSKLSHKYDIPAESILVGNGAAELIDLVVKLLKPSVTGLCRPSFSEYEEAVHQAGGRIHSIPLQAEHSFILRSEDLISSYDSCDLLFLGHPNNPTGQLIPRQVIEELVSSGKRVVLDEAFMDFIPDEREHSMIKLAAVNKDVFVIRSMTKFYSVPGIRLGFIVAHPDWIRKLKAMQVQWSVNYLAQLIGCAVLDDADYERKSREWLAVEAPWLANELTKLGLRVTNSDVNFLLFSFPEELRLTVKEVQREMGLKGILIRDASLFEGLHDRYCRVAVRLRADNVQLVSELRGMLSDHQNKLLSGHYAGQEDEPLERVFHDRQVDSEQPERLENGTGLNINDMSKRGNLRES
ncbi:threonine-phosphate decarboxylase CobD [Paenibacillus hexagrammi]|uniref:threonine-phosphate decarboxylase n=1 Tax=Paenibacillus hexagrammi TaxID=2908839 RepID=A0ABY3SMP6_9BACL|nr:threonine-phosphate decarboxylase CobD [Paenibacillus sp. YPD9-1]UJF34476.1 threonine-phosphate decarboxylase CobD [Paenibacillus sp. YPD9-1]